MKKILSIAAAALCLCAVSCSAAKSSSNQIDLRSGASTLGNLIEGVFSTSNLDIEDLAGEWTANGSAVKFKSENFLNKAGGLAAAAALETKLDPYYKQLGLNGAVLTIQTDGSFTMLVKKMKLTGKITKLNDGNFNFNFQILGGMSIGNMTTYVSKTSNQMDVMFDVQKLTSIIKAVGSITGLKTVQAVTAILDGYDGICVGFKMQKTGKVEGEKTTVGSVIGDIFGGNKNSSTSGSNTNTESNENKSQGSLLDLLKKK